MKLGKSLNDMIRELDRRAKVRDDYIANSTEMVHTTIPETKESRIAMDVKGYGLVDVDLKPLAHDQLLQRLEIPSAYDRKVLSGFPELLDYNINYLMRNKSQPMMIRTLDGHADAVLSNAYKRIDNYPVAEAVIPILYENQVKVESCEVTDNKMYIKVVSPRLMADVKVNDPVQLGIVISNSEVGLGFLNVQLMIYRLVCLNGMITGRDYGDGIRMAHRGSRQPLGVVYAEDTMRTHGRAIALQVRDTVKQILSPETFEKHLDILRGSTERKVTGDPVKAVEQLGKVVGFTQDEGSSIMRHLIEGGDLSQYGLMNAVTRFAQDDQVDYDRATELERIGGKVIELNKSQWKSVAEAA